MTLAIHHNRAARRERAGFSKVPGDLQSGAIGATNLLAFIAFFAISLIFPVLAAQSGAIPFGFFAAMMAVQALVVWRFYPGKLPASRWKRCRSASALKTTSRNRRG